MPKKIKVDNFIHGMILEKITKDVVIVKTGIGYEKYSQEELQQEIKDLSFFKHAFLVILNENATKNSHLPFNKKEVLEYAREIYRNESWDQKFIDRCFDVE